MRRVGVALVLVVSLSGIAAGCGGDDGQTAEERAQQAVCNDADTLQRAVETLIDDVTSANFVMPRISSPRWSPRSPPWSTRPRS